MVKEKFTIKAVGAIPRKLGQDEDMNLLSEVLQSSQKVQNMDKENSA